MKKALASLFAVLVVFSVSGCSTEKYGAGVDTKITAVKTKDIFLDSKIVGRKVTVEGKISSQCASNGCWFVLQDDTGHPFRGHRQAKKILFSKFFDFSFFYELPIILPMPFFL